MRVLISAGGSGGHIYPALAIIDKIKEMEPDSEFLYIGTHNRMEKDIVPKHGIPFKTIKIYGLERRHIWKNIKVLWCLFFAARKSKKIIKEFNPDVVIGVGGYVTVPVLSQAKKLGIKTFMHEQNSIPGRANLMLAKKVDKIAVSLKSTLEHFPADKTIFTGNPCSEAAMNAEAMEKSELGLDANKKLVLIVMGSQGASTVNEVLIDTLPLVEDKNYQVLYVTGKNDYDKISTYSFPTNVKVVPYIDGMIRIMKRTDLIVTRAGASTMSEIIALGIPSILIPSPYVPNNHQYKNALDLVNINAADLIEEKDLKAETLIDAMNNILTKEETQKEMKKNLESVRVYNSATVIYESIKELLERH